MFASALLSLAKEITLYTDTMLSQKQTYLIASALGFLAVSLGAFGAHAFKAFLVANGRLDTYELAVRYHFYHTFALLAVGLVMDKYSTSGVKLSALLFLIGILLFSGSLYALCLLNITKIAIITPIGGVFLIAAWITLFISFFQSPKNHS
jgi:uncharacterized membrane protein YgdD (TMEM256/DUF423 family)